MSVAIMGLVAITLVPYAPIVERASDVIRPVATVGGGSSNGLLMSDDMSLLWGVFSICVRVT
jgi:hypothetical protein